MEDDEGGRKTQDNLSKLDRRVLGFLRIGCGVSGLIIGIFLIAAGSCALYFSPLEF
ncbi:MAG: hypothetical protein ABI955_14560 [Nitrospirota bacterium]